MRRVHTEMCGVTVAFPSPFVPSLARTLHTHTRTHAFIPHIKCLNIMKCFSWLRAYKKEDESCKIMYLNKPKPKNLNQNKNTQNIFISPTKCLQSDLRCLYSKCSTRIFSDSFPMIFVIFFFFLCVCYR